MVPFLAVLTKVGFYTLALKMAVSGGMSIWMCSNLENITSIVNSTRNIEFSMEHIQARIGEAALTTGYECGDRCADIIEMADYYNKEVSDILQINCKNPNSNLLSLGMSPTTCEYITSNEGTSNIIKSINYGAIEYKPGKSKEVISTEIDVFNPKGSTDTGIINKNDNTIVSLYSLFNERKGGIQDYLSNKYETVVKTTKNARRHIGWLVQGKTKTLEIINQIITSFINNLKLFLEKDFLHLKSKIQKKYEDYELCANYIQQTFTTALSILPLASAI